MMFSLSFILFLSCSVMAGLDPGPDPSYVLTRRHARHTAGHDVERMSPTPAPSCRS